MPADLTAPELIALLREHPGACVSIDVFVVGSGANELAMARRDGINLFGDSGPDPSVRFRRWLTGAAVEKCDEMDIEIVRYADGFGTIERHVFKPTTFGGGTGIKIGKKHPTRLRAALAAIEAHAKEIAR